MDLEEQKLKQRIDERQIALQEKIEILKARVNPVKRMDDVKSQVEQRPVLMLTGSVLAGVLTKKLLGGRNRRHSRYSYDSRRAGRSATERGHLWGSASAIISAIVIRAATAMVSDFVRKRVPRRR
ncbi:MAG TPA: hypothetical protein VEG60_20435 [Candidatus Binatia bacterium]|nr:hypothetical protein [Candidatus Binatia bacterium]